MLGIGYQNPVCGVCVFERERQLKKGGGRINDSDAT